MRQKTKSAYGKRPVSKNPILNEDEDPKHHSRRSSHVEDDFDLIDFYEESKSPEFGDNFERPNQGNMLQSKWHDLSKIFILCSPLFS
jgi:hypothetical protein